MARSIWQRYMQDDRGRPRSGVVITVEEVGSEVPADIYTAETGGVPVSSVTSNSAGRAFFWVNPGVYNVTATYNGSTAIEQNVEIGPVLRGGVDIPAQLIFSNVFYGTSIAVEVVGGVATCDASLATGFTITLTANITSVEIIGLDSAISQSFEVEIVNTGAYTVGAFEATQVGYTVKIPDSVSSLQPKANDTTMYGCSIKGSTRLNIFPVEMKDL